MDSSVSSAVGIVKKTIMMIDFTLEAQQTNKTAAGRSIKVAWWIPADHDDHDGGIDGYFTDRAGLWPGRSQTSSRRIRSWAFLLSNRDALPHSCCLHLRKCAALGGDYSPEACEFDVASSSAGSVSTMGED